MQNQLNTKILAALWSILLLVLVGLYSAQNNMDTAVNFSQKRAVLNRFVLTDYCLSTESRHIRHIALPELIAPFQDAPAWLEHFPSSAFFPPNRGLFEHK
jgi:hypothetical protein